MVDDLRQFKWRYIVSADGLADVIVLTEHTFKGATGKEDGV